MAHNPTLITYALPSPPPGRSPSAPVPRVDRYGIGVDARSTPASVQRPVSPSAATAGSIQELSGHRIARDDRSRMGWSAG
eukprot:2393539-Prymnesium_polylepis.1